jgi:DeoR/GlpR family transcriptional regulator of sugar metabolism
VTKGNALALPSDRHQPILELIAENGSVRVAYLVAEFGVSRMTINRDLDRLSEAASLTKVFGGAITPHTEETGAPTNREMCGAPIGSRTAMTLFDGEGEHASGNEL